MAALLTAAELSHRLGELTVLDVRWELAGGPDRAGYDAGHVPGAALVDLETELAGPPGEGGRHPLPTAEAFAESMRAAGVWSDRGVVTYDGGSSTAAARAWWLLRYYGHPQAMVLDGGLAAWREAGLPLEAGPVLCERGEFVARPGGMALLDAPAASALAGSGLLIDARAPERFRGEHEPIDPVAGHVPGAVNRPTGLNLEPSGRFLASDALREAFVALGVREGIEVGAYCGSGVTAAHEVLALELAGFPAALYAGSWSHWITDPTRPVATGD